MTAWAGVQLVPFAALVLAGVLVADRLEADRFRQMLRSQVGIERNQRGDLDGSAIGHALRREHGGPHGNRPAQRQCRNADAQHPFLHDPSPVFPLAKG